MIHNSRHIVVAVVCDVAVSSDYQSTLTPSHPIVGGNTRFKSDHSCRRSSLCGLQRQHIVAVKAIWSAMSLLSDTARMTVSVSIH